jgi:hypothetical protein
MRATLAGLCLLTAASAFAYKTEQISPAPQASEQYNQQYQQSKKTDHYAHNFNIRFLGSGIFNGFLGASIDFQIRSAFTVGPMAKGFISKSNSGYLIGFNSIYATDGNVFSTGWIINPYLGYYSSDYKLKRKDNSAVLGANFGYQWMFADKLNAQVGAGAYFSSHPIPITTNEDGNFFPTLMASVGYSF